MNNFLEEFMNNPKRIIQELFILDGRIMNYQ